MGGAGIAFAGALSALQLIAAAPGPGGITTPLLPGQAIGFASGTGTALGVGASTAASVGLATGSGSGGGIAPLGAVGAAAGTGSAAGVGRSLAEAVGLATGSGAASGIAPGGAQTFTAGVMVHGGSEANPYVQGWIGFKRGDFFPATMHLVATYPSHTIQCQHDAVQTFSDGSCRQAIVGFYMASTLSDGVEQLVTITPTAGAQAT